MAGVGNHVGDVACQRRVLRFDMTLPCVGFIPNRKGFSP